MATKTKPILDKLNERSTNGVHEQQTDEPVSITITPPNMKTLTLGIIGTTPLVTLRFGTKAQYMMKVTQEAGSVGKSKRKRDPKNFEECYEDAKHVSTDDWCGIPCMSVRHAMIDACTLADTFKTVAKKTIFIEADGWGSADGAPLIKITKGEPHMIVSPVRNASGVADLRARAMWDAGWEATIRIRYDADRFSAGDIANLLARAGAQCGICEGRPNGKKSNGCGWGLFGLMS